jgi:hypothetical protein
MLYRSEPLITVHRGVARAFRLLYNTRKHSCSPISRSHVRMSSYPTTAHAITISKPGGVEVLEKTEVPLDVKPDHILIKVRWS